MVLLCPKITYLVQHHIKNQRKTTLSLFSIEIHIWKWNSHSVSSTYASIRRRTNPTATPTRTSPLMMPAIWKISAAALHVEEAAPPLLPLDGYFNELTTLAKHCSVHTGRPNDVTLFWAFNPPKELIPLMNCTLLSLLLVLPTTVIVAGIVALAMAILSEMRKHGQKWRIG